VSSSAFCSAAKKWAANNAKETSALAGAANGNLKTFYTTLAKEYQQIISAAPSQIKPDLQVLIGVFNKFYVVLQQNNFDIQKAAPKLAGMASELNSPQIKQAEQHLQAWAKANNCAFKS
jgi:antirestriction protein ArdC